MTDFNFRKEVLVRDNDKEEWKFRFFGYKKDKAYYCVTSFEWYLQCIPYAGNEKLLGTCNAPEPEWEPKRGELVAVRQNKTTDWVVRVFDHKRQDLTFPWICGDGSLADNQLCGWRYCEPFKRHFNVEE